MIEFFDIDWGFGSTEAPAPAESQDSQPKRRNRSHLKAKVYETSDKFEYRRAFSEIQLLDTLGGHSGSKLEKLTTFSPRATSTVSRSSRPCSGSRASVTLW